MTDVPHDDRWIDELMAERLARMRYTKRKSETTLARWTAKATIAATLGYATDPQSLQTVIVRNAYDGAPFVEVAGSHRNLEIAMTDRADHAVCMVLAGHGRIGCDLELVEQRSAAFVRDYFTSSEQRAVAADDQPDLMANLIWSAKESALKVLRTGLRRDTRTVEVEVGDPTDGPWHPLTITGDEGRVFPGWWFVAGEFVLTCATERPTAPPRSLVDPHGLTDAVPAHAWMDGMR
ncbi:MAG: 4'-phosphopantetheinyl transferase superfamily protein [Acidimicrobiia bacterium]|nr:4'-phosphopantetheinyl transferase superfamily protein [Acidimicrobiia bacterium]